MVERIVLLNAASLAVVQAKDNNWRGPKVNTVSVLEVDLELNILLPERLLRSETASLEVYDSRTRNKTETGCIEETVRIRVSGKVYVKWGKRKEENISPSSQGVSGGTIYLRARAYCFPRKIRAEHVADSN
ncbi:hypothetical protein EDD18DRAFT_1109678 [Armillaria luteobubalina]|uniref:Arrestin-like N-terminal domain-containing protein n=1 Tax=Armillaria luteobubalina TaxID=153913 RepID=A0AA39PTH8_9AGAR|nr:hypothetical protein EDD18DRAFT_1109678 [Armillaria luteobubalina]